MLWHRGPCWALVLLVTCLLSASPGSATLNFSNHGYDGLVVAIADSVPENPELIEEIKAMMTSASAYLFTATQSKAHFRSVRILVPRNWTRGAGWEDRKEGERLETAEVRVDEASPLYGDTPYTFQPGQCGEPGRYIHLTPRFLAEPAFRNRTYGDAGRLLVHEFAHLRFGVYDEYGFGDDKYPRFYLNDRKEVTATGCTSRVKGVFSTINNQRCTENATTNLPNSDCRFVPDIQSNTARASIMFHQAVESVDQFCNRSLDGELRHNRNAPNQQNALCRRRATWEVISLHPDMNVPSSIAMDTTPSFTVVQEPAVSNRKCGKRGVMVMDVSGSMSGGRLSRLTQSAAAFIDNLPEGSRIAMVTFTDFATTIATFRDVYSQADKGFLDSKLPTLANGGTSIGAGLRRAKQLLDADGSTSEGDFIFLATDGEDGGVQSAVDELMPEFQSAKIQVHTMAYSNAADAVLSRLSSQSGGKYYFFNEGENGTELIGASRDVIASITTCAFEVKVELDKTGFTFQGTGLLYQRSVLVDSTVGRNLTFNLFLEGGGAANVEVSVTSPSGTIYNASSPEYTRDSVRDIVSFVIPSALSGLWTYRISASSSSSVSGSAVGVVQSEAAQEGVAPIQLEAWMGGLFADPALRQYAAVYAHLHQSYAPLVGADVKAVVTRPSPFTQVTLELKDDGLIPDVREGDGVYSAYFTQYTANSRYSVDIRMQSVPGKTSLVRAASNTGAEPISPVAPVATELEPVANLSRTATAGAFDVANATDADVIPPGEITDLRLVALDSTSRSVSLAWTSPGDDIRSGMVSMYDLRIGASYDHLTSNFSNAVKVTSDMLLEGDLDPLPAGERHEVKVNLSRPFPWSNLTFVFGVKAWDDANLTTDVSNLLVVTFEPVTYPQNTGADPVPEELQNAETDPVTEPSPPSTQPTSQESVNWQTIAIGVGVGGAVLVIVIVVVIVCVLMSRRQKFIIPKKSQSRNEIA